jgi:hypothetical protein
VKLELVFLDDDRCLEEMLLFCQLQGRERRASANRAQPGGVACGISALLDMG